MAFSQRDCKVRSPTFSHPRHAEHLESVSPVTPWGTCIKSGDIYTLGCNEEKVRSSAGFDEAWDIAFSIGSFSSRRRSPRREIINSHHFSSQNSSMNAVHDGISQIHSFSRRSIENVSCTSSDWFQKNYLDRYFFKIIMFPGEWMVRIIKFTEIIFWASQHQFRLRMIMPVGLSRLDPVTPLDQWL